MDELEDVEMDFADLSETFPANDGDDVQIPCRCWMKLGVRLVERDLPPNIGLKSLTFDEDIERLSLFNGMKLDLVRKTGNEAYWPP